jgi:hypothetical protein
MAKYKYILTVIITLCTLITYAQPAQYTPMTAAGYQMKRLKIDSTLHLPSFCGVPTLRGSLAKEGALAIDTCGGFLFIWTNENGWDTIGGSGGSGSPTDTTSLSNRINLKIDSIRRISDSVFAWINGTAYFQYTDSVGGGGGNFWKISGITNLTDDVTIKTDKNIQFSGIDNEILKFYVLAEDIKLTTSTNQIALSGLQSTTDTSTYKPLGIDNNGQLAPLTSWVSGGGGAGVDTIFRTLGKDSIFYKKNNITYAIKDSVGGGAFLPLSGGTLTGNLNGTTATFSSNGSSNTFNINHTSGSGHGLEITKAGNGEGIIVNKTSGSGNAVTITGTLNATTLVKNGGTSSQFLKADGSVDATTYVSDTSALQRKSLSANTIMANNTSGTANATEQFFKQFGNQTYSDSITFTGVTNPSGAFNHTFRYSQIGNLVTLHITLTYATAGSLSQVAIEIPDGLPIPILPNGLTANNDIISYGSGFMTSTTTAVAIVFSKVFLRQNTGLVNDYEIVINQASNSTYRIFNATIQYFAQ